MNRPGSRTLHPRHQTSPLQKHSRTGVKTPAYPSNPDTTRNHDRSSRHTKRTTDARAASRQPRVCTARRRLPGECHPRLPDASSARRSHTADHAANCKTDDDPPSQTHGRFQNPSENQRSFQTVADWSRWVCQNSELSRLLYGWMIFGMGKGDGGEGDSPAKVDGPRWNRSNRIDRAEPSSRGTFEDLPQVGWHP